MGVFGLVDEEDYVRDLFACAVDQATLDRQKEDLLTYIGRASSPTPIEVPRWRPKVSTIGSVQVSNFIMAARSGNVAELRFFNYSVGDVVEAGRAGKTEVRAFPVALLRCEDSLQQAMFLSLYTEKKIKDAPIRK